MVDDDDNTACFSSDYDYPRSELFLGPPFVDSPITFMLPWYHMDRTAKTFIEP